MTSLIWSAAPLPTPSTRYAGRRSYERETGKVFPSRHLRSAAGFSEECCHVGNANIVDDLNNRRYGGFNFILRFNGNILRVCMDAAGHLHSQFVYVVARRVPAILRGFEIRGIDE